MAGLLKIWNGTEWIEIAGGGGEGTEGPEGPQGPAGNTGATGAAGSDGADGADGSDGADGVDGSDATVDRTNVYDQVKEIIVGGTNITATDNDTAETVTLAGQAGGGTGTAGGLTFRLITASGSNYTLNTDEASIYVVVAEESERYTALIPTLDLTTSTQTYAIDTFNPAGAATDTRVVEIDVSLSSSVATIAIGNGQGAIVAVYGVSGGGEQGVAGADGATGSAGSDGSDGSDGNNGAQGSQGVQGEQGEQGIQGVQGPAGSGSSFDIHDDVTISSGLALADRFIFADENTAGDPMRYIRADNFATWVNNQGGGVEGPEGPEGPQGPAGADGGINNIDDFTTVTSIAGQDKIGIADVSNSDDDRKVTFSTLALGLTGHTTGGIASNSSGALFVRPSEWPTTTAIEIGDKLAFEDVSISNNSPPKVITLENLVAAIAGDNLTANSGVLDAATGGGTATNGLPTSGDDEDILAKASSTNYDTEWIHPLDPLKNLTAAATTSGADHIFFADDSNSNNIRYNTYSSIRNDIRPNVQNSGTTLASPGPPATINFTGNGVTATESNGTATVSIPGGGSVTISNNAPSGASDGDLWYDT